MRRKTRQISSLRTQLAPVGLGVCVGGVLLGGIAAPSAHAQAAPTGPEAAKMEKIERENQDLRKRLETLEHMAQKEGIMASGEAPKSMPIQALSSMNISGFVTASYFYDTSSPKDGSPNGYLWNRHDNSFTLNKVKLTLASPAAERSGDKWDAGYRVSLIFGEDAPIVNTGGEFQGFESLREAYVDLNIPLGTGLNVKAGQLISLLNFESGDGGAVNPNFSQGNQWYFTGNGPSAGVNVGYTFTDWLSANVRIQNGLYTGAIDNNDYKTMMGNLVITPDKYTSIALIGFGGREGGNPANWLKGASLIASRKLMEKFNLNIATEFDYFNLDTGADSSSYWWSIGGWAWMDFTPKIGIALRGDSTGPGPAAGGCKRDKREEETEACVH